VSGLRVYHRAGAGRPIRVVWAPEEVGADCELVTITAEEARDTKHRTRHPLGRVPVLEDERGPMFESTALVFHMAELYPTLGWCHRQPHMSARSCRAGRSLR
jgi:glutathione S-transferase